MPLFEAARSSDVAAIDAALDGGHEPELLRKDPDGHTLVHALIASAFSSKAGDISRLFPWSRPERTIFRHHFSSLIGAGLESTLRRLLHTAPSLCCDPDRRGITPLHLAAMLGLGGIVRLLLAAGADPMAGAAAPTGLRTPLDEAMRHGQKEVILQLVHALPDAERIATWRRIGDETHGNRTCDPVRPGSNH